MPKVKKAPVTKFEEYIKKAISNIESIRTKQEQKEAILEEYEKQHRRYAEGRISRRAYKIAVDKNKALLKSIDTQIKRSITTTKNALQSTLRIASKQAPVGFKISMDGLTKPAKKAIKDIKKIVKKQKKPVRRVAKRKPVKRRKR
jgi:hypothetical protein